MWFVDVHREEPKNANFELLRKIYKLDNVRYHLLAFIYFANLFDFVTIIKR